MDVGLCENVEQTPEDQEWSMLRMVFQLQEGFLQGQEDSTIGGSSSPCGCTGRFDVLDAGKGHFSNLLQKHLLCIVKHLQMPMLEKIV